MTDVARTADASEQMKKGKRTYSDSDSSGCMSFSSRSCGDGLARMSISMLSSSPYLAQPVFQILQLALLDDQVAVIVQVLHDIVVLFLVVFEDNCLDRRVTLNQDTCCVG